MQCGPKILCPIVHPTKCCDVHDTEVFQVPHVHPSHTTLHHHKIFEHVHTCPHTVSNVCDVAQQHFDCCGGSMPGMGMGPGMGMAPGMAPGMYPGIAPGMAPGMGMVPSMAPGMGPGLGMAPSMIPGAGMGMTPEMMMPAPRFNPFFRP
ncbi:MAG TPA: spore coat protein CotD [Bacillales bacterium]|nr:spore coat protein CotD [Bacillales bacterium]